MAGFFLTEISYEVGIQIVENIARNNYLIFILHKPTEYNLRKFNYYNQIKNNKNIELRPRYTYFDFIKLLLDANFVVSDGGSNQEECYYLGKPIILLRESTERDEGLDRNCVLSKYDDLVIDEFLDNIDQYRFDFFNLDTSPCEIIIDSCLPFS
jgi:UDP-N-acetylglucosamine 2-epimerase (non-hydrolysing)